MLLLDQRGCQKRFESGCGGNESSIGRVCFRRSDLLTSVRFGFGRTMIVDTAAMAANRVSSGSLIFAHDENQVGPPAIVSLAVQNGMPVTICDGPHE